MNINEIENIYLKEEENYVNKLTNMFMENWQSVSVLREKHILSEMIGLLNDQKHPISKEIYHLTRKQTRSVEKQKKILASAHSAN